MKRSKKSFIALILFGLIIIGLCFSSLMAKKEPKYVWKWATLGQDSIKMMEILTLDFTHAALKATNGDLKFVWYTGAIMGDEEDYLAKMRIGQLQAAMLSGTCNADVCPGITVTELPFLFNNMEEVIYVRERLRPKLNKIAEKKGFIILMTMDVESNFYSTKYPLKQIEDFKKSKILTWHGPLEAEVLKSLGSSPIPVNVPDVVPSVRSGVVDGAISPSLWWLAAQLYTITKYINPVPIRFDQAIFVVLKSEWKKLPAYQRDKLRRIALEIEGEVKKEAIRVSDDARKGMIDYGCKEVCMTTEEIDILRKRTMTVWNKMAGKEYPKELLNEVMDYLKSYRANRVR
ncbi:MAG: TRAP transporter substrate-binding protein DctP [Spirochaetota bacterium]|nr:TRAP transporter substrate-binding protein DctP [Spirochaetota bacterium]